MESIGYIHCLECDVKKSYIVSNLRGAQAFMSESIKHKNHLAFAITLVITSPDDIGKYLKDGELSETLLRNILNSGLTGSKTVDVEEKDITVIKDEKEPEVDVKSETETKNEDVEEKDNA